MRGRGHLCWGQPTPPSLPGEGWGGEGGGERSRGARPAAREEPPAGFGAKGGGGAVARREGAIVCEGPRPGPCPGVNKQINGAQSLV